MYTLDQQLKDIDKAIEIVKYKRKKQKLPFICAISRDISKEFNEFMKRRLIDMKNISPTAYEECINNLTNRAGGRTIEEALSDFALWHSRDYNSRLQFLNDLRNWFIDNG